MPVDVSGFAFFAPIWAFLAVFAIVFALLFKTKVLGDHKWGLLFISFVIATIFISAASVQQYVLTIIPWLAVLIVSLFFIMVLIGFVGKSDWMGKGIQVGVVILALILFVVSGVKVFYGVISPYFPFSSNYGSGVNDLGALAFSNWILSGPVLGAVFLLILSGLVSWVLVKAK